MKEQYYLNNDSLPTIPIPHDCIVKIIRSQGEYIVLEFENDISYHDIIKSINPDAKSLIMRFHLIADGDVQVYKRKRWGIFHKHSGYERLDHNAVRSLDERLEYLYHYVSYCSIIIKFNQIIIDADADSVELEWIY